MAELILTQDEKDAALWSDLDDAALGKVVKKTISIFDSAAEQMESTAVQSAAIYLCWYANANSASRAVFELGGITYAGVELGDWIVTVEEKPAIDAARQKGGAA